LIRYLTRRFLPGIFVLAGISIVTFTIARAVPSNPAALWVGPRATADQIAAATVELGLDKPLPVQYLRYMKDLLSGNWGFSIRTHQPVRHEIAGFFAASLELVLAGLVIAVILSVPLGVIAAVKKDAFIDKLIRFIGVSGVSLPVFWLGMIFQLVFFKTLRLFPLGGRVSTQVSLSFPLKEGGTGFFLLDSLAQGNFIFFTDALAHIILPAVVMASYPLGLLIKMLRSSMIEVLNSEHNRVLEAFGVKKSRRIFKYDLKNALGPAVTSLGLIFANSLTSTFLIESVFSWPGLGRYTSLAILSNDYPVTMAVTFLVAFFYIFTNIVVDILLAVIDPRLDIQA
jgi:peptide/nickel transport system permease protein